MLNFYLKSIIKTKDNIVQKNYINNEKKKNTTHIYPAECQMHFLQKLHTWQSMIIFHNIRALP